MNSKLLQNINLQVYSRFPEFKGSQPKVENQAAGPSAAPGATRFTLIYRTQAIAANGRTMPRTVRVVVNEDGKILKMSSSRS